MFLSKSCQSISRIVRILICLTFILSCLKGHPAVKDTGDHTVNFTQMVTSPEDDVNDVLRNTTGAQSTEVGSKARPKNVKSKSSAKGKPSGWLIYSRIKIQGNIRICRMIRIVLNPLRSQTFVNLT